MTARARTLAGLSISDAFPHDIARGIVPGARPFNGYGERTTAGAESNVLWPDGVYAIPPSSGVQLTLASTSVEDDSAGTGIRVLEIHYLDTALDEQVEEVTLDGTTPVLTVATNIRFVQCMHLVTAGSTKAAVGTITASVGAQVYSQISAGSNRCASSVRMVPRGKRLIVTSLYAGSTSGSAAAKAIIRIASPNFEGHDTTASGIFIPFASATFQDSSNGLTIPCPLSFTEGEVFGMTFTVDKAATIVGSWFGWLEDAA